MGDETSLKYDAMQPRCCHKTLRPRLCLRHAVPTNYQE